MSFLSNPLLVGSASAKSKTSGLTATKRKASNGNQAQGSVPSKQPTTGMSLQSSSLLLGSSLLGGNPKFGLGLQSSSLGTKSPLMASTGFNSKPQGSSGSGRSPLAGGSLLSSSSYLSSSSSLSSSTYGSAPTYGSSVLPSNKQQTRSLSRSNSNQVDDSKTKKVKSQHHPEQTKVKEDSVIDPTLTTCELPDYDFSRQLPVARAAVPEYLPSFENLDMVNTLSTKPGENRLTELKVEYSCPWFILMFPGLIISWFFFFLLLPWFSLFFLNFSEFFYSKGGGGGGGWGRMLLDATFPPKYFFLLLRKTKQFFLVLIITPVFQIILYWCKVISPNKREYVWLWIINSSSRKVHQSWLRHNIYLQFSSRRVDESSKISGLCTI